MHLTTSQPPHYYKLVYTPAQTAHKLHLQAVWLNLDF